MAETLTKTIDRSVESSPVDELVAYLRSQPYKVDHSRFELAEKFGLDVEFVGDVLDTLRGSPNKLPTFDSFFRASLTTVRTVGSTVSKLYDEFTERAVIAVFVTAVLGVAVIFLTRQASLVGFVPVSDNDVNVTFQSIAGVTGGAIFVLHALVYLRHGMLRFSIYGSLIVLAITAPLLVYFGKGEQIVLGPGQVIPDNRVVPLLIFAAIAITIFYFLFSAFTCLLGGYLKSNRADRQEKRLSRQELIDRLFYLQERLKEEKFDPTLRRKPSLLTVLRTTPWIPIIGLTTGVLLGLVTVSMRSALAGDPASDARQSMSLPGVVNLASQSLTGLAFMALGYFSGGIRRAFVVLVLMFAGTLMAESLPFRYFGPAYIEQLVESGALLEGVVNTLFLALIVGVGAHIDKRARVRRKLREHDPAHVAAEIVEIQWRLNPSAAASCVVVVDVAGSTRMKTEADHLAVEYSFRAYQELVSKVTAKRGGSVLSTAGDGAVLIFASCAEALYAAKEIQTQMSLFNARTNRLSSAFRLRVGIHTGQVSAQLQEVPFNEIIDIAAHVEREAPVGGIAITQSVVEDLQDERVAGLKDQVDGQNVYVVLNPTLVV